jgi:hypothetical protein
VIVAARVMSSAVSAIAVVTDLTTFLQITLMDVKTAVVTLTAHLLVLLLAMVLDSARARDT